MLTELRLDAETVGVFLRQLEDIETEVQKVEYADLPFSNGNICPLDIQNKPHIRTVTYRQTNKVGRFALQRSYSSNLPMINTLAQEFTQKVHKWGAGYWFSDDDIEAVVATGMELESEQISGVKEASEQELNRLIAFGEPKLKLPGFLNHPDILYSFAPYQINSDRTAQEILALLHDSVTSVVKLTMQIEKPDTMLLPVDQYHYLANTIVVVDGQSTGQSIMKQFLETSPYIKDIEPINELAGAGIEGMDLVYIYRRDKSKVKARIMQPLTWKEMQRRGLGYERAAVFRFGGVVFYRPLSAHAVSGI